MLSERGLRIDRSGVCCLMEKNVERERGREMFECPGLSVTFTFEVHL
jgi:hypothetical protein